MLARIEGSVKTKAWVGGVTNNVLQLPLDIIERNFLTDPEDLVDGPDEHEDADDEEAATIPMKSAAQEEDYEPATTQCGY